MAVNQIAVPALGVAVPLRAVVDEPLAAPLPDREIIFFLHIIASFLANEQYHRKQEIATEKNGIFVGKQLFQTLPLAIFLVILVNC